MKNSNEVPFNFSVKFKINPADILILLLRSVPKALTSKGYFPQGNEIDRPFTGMTVCFIGSFLILSPKPFNHLQTQQ